MASLADDYRFARTPSSQSHSEEEEDDEPIWGSSNSSNGPSWRQGSSSFASNGFDDGPEASTSYVPDEAGPSQAAHTDLYATLNLDKDCSTEDVLRSYRSLAVAFHPDKHRDPNLKLAAQNRFEKVQHAYEVLSDSQKRAVYDLLGEEGLKSSWEVGQKLKSPDELRAEYEKNRLQRAQADIENLIRSRASQLTVDGLEHMLNSVSAQTEANISLDASRSFDRSATLLQAISSIASADVRQLFMKASTVSVLSPSTVITYSGSMVARRSAGGGNLLVNLKHQYSPKLSIDVGATVISPKRATAKVVYAVSQDTFVNFDSTILSPYTPPPFNLTYGTRVAKSITGFVKFSSGSSYSVISLFLPSFQPMAGAPSTVTVGAAASAYSVEVTANQFGQTSVSGNYGDVRLLGGGKQHGWKLSTNVGATSQGQATLGIGTEKRLTENTNIGLGLGVVVSTGALTLRIRVSRLGQRLTIPVLLSQAASPRMIFATIFIPGLSIASLQYFYLTPRRRKRICSKLKELREEQKGANEEKRKEALEAIELLREQVERKREVERTKDGLVILEASYKGAGKGVDPQEARETELDVTIPLQALVTNTTSSRTRSEGDGGNSTLVIPAGRSKAGIIGFCDVLVGSKKVLLIKYLFNGRRHEASFDDYQAVALPMRSHLVE